MTAPPRRSRTGRQRKLSNMRLEGSSRARQIATAGRGGGNGNGGALEIVADEGLGVFAGLTVPLLLGMPPSPRILIDDLPSSSLVRGFMCGVDWDRREDAESTLAGDVVVVTWDGS